LNALSLRDTPNLFFFPLLYYPLPASSGGKGDFLFLSGAKIGGQAKGSRMKPPRLKRVEDTILFLTVGIKLWQFYW